MRCLRSRVSTFVQRPELLVFPSACIGVRARILSRFGGKFTCEPSKSTVSRLNFNFVVMKFLSLRERGTHFGAKFTEMNRHVVFRTSSCVYVVMYLFCDFDLLLYILPS